MIYWAIHERYVFLIKKNANTNAIQLAGFYVSGPIVFSNHENFYNLFLIYTKEPWKVFFVFVFLSLIGQYKKDILLCFIYIVFIVVFLEDLSKSKSVARYILILFTVSLLRF